MTSFAFILGVLPLMLASGAGAASRHSIGTGVFAGMLFATMIGIFFIPLFFRVIRRLAERRSTRATHAWRTGGGGRLMRRAFAVLAWMGVTIVGCKVGPRYKPEPVIPPAERIGVTPSSDSARRFFDSLAVERARDSLPLVAPNAPHPTLNAAAANAAAWLDIIHDTTLVSLVDIALRQNRDLQRGDRANQGVPRGRRHCARSTAAERERQRHARARIRLRSARSRRRRIARRALTGDLAWELDFWGRVRRRRRGGERGPRRAGSGGARDGAVARQRCRLELPATARAGPGARDRRADVEHA